MRLLLLLIIITLSTTIFIPRWKHATAHPQPVITIHRSIYSHAYRKAYISSMKSTFNVSYVEHTTTECINPFFPAIHITTETPHDGWIHIVYTNSQCPHLRSFVDAPDPKIYPDLYPFYTLEQDFYDAPQWDYTLFSKPINYWHRHAYAVKIDRNHHTITIIGGVNWGYTLSTFSLYPKMVYPQPLSKQDLIKDLSILQTVFTITFIDQ